MEPSNIVLATAKPAELTGDLHDFNINEVDHDPSYDQKSTEKIINSSFPGYDLHACQVEKMPVCTFWDENNRQSYNMRLRKERMKEKIRILERMVPGGSEFSRDTAAILDEAIKYVKFLEARVQLLEGAAAGRKYHLGQGLAIPRTETAARDQE